MKVIFHPRFYEVYACDPAAAPGRMESIVITAPSEVGAKISPLKGVKEDDLASWKEAIITPSSEET